MGGALGGSRFLLVLAALLLNWGLALLLWRLLLGAQPTLSLVLVLCSIMAAAGLLWLSTALSRPVWLHVWGLAGPWLLAPLAQLGLTSARLPLALLSPLAWVGLGAWAAVRWWPLRRRDSRLHRARFAKGDELASLTSHTPPDTGLLLAHRARGFLAVTPLPHRRELGNLLIIGPTRSGKGLLATSQLLSWQHSVVVNDIKGELFAATAGYRSRLGPVFVIDPAAVGHRYDPLAHRSGEDGLFAAAASLLLSPGESDGLIFTQRAVVMLTQLFAAARKETVPPLPYVRTLVRMGLSAAARRLQAVDPQLATQFLDAPVPEANFSDRFLLSAWSTLSTRLHPLLTETLVRCFAGTDIDAAALLRAPRPVSVYLRWPERDLIALSPLIRLLWGSLIGELVTIYDTCQGQGCRPVLLLVDEAGRTAIPTLADHATTVVGRGLSLWIAIQSLSQLEAVYGRARAQVLKDNMDSQLFYRPTDLPTAQYLEHRLGQVSGFAHSQTLRDGTATAEGRSERPIPLLTAQDILQLEDREIIGFHRRLAPFRATRADWRSHRVLAARHGLSAPQLRSLPLTNELPAGSAPVTGLTAAYIDPDRTASVVRSETSA